MTSNFEWPEGWGDSAIVSGIRQNKDGTITANVEIFVDSDDGRRWVTRRTVRMQREKSEK